MFCVCARGDHFILHGHYGIHYHLNDAPVEASICWLTVAWEVSSSSLVLDHAVYPIMLAGGFYSLAGPHLFRQAGGVSGGWELEVRWLVAVPYPGNA